MCYGFTNTEPELFEVHGDMRTEVVSLLLLESSFHTKVLVLNFKSKVRTYFKE
jgi:hypothetical protein